jgi:restriction endonuclease S subunit
MNVVSFDELIRDDALQVGDGYRAKNDELGGSGPIFLRAAYLQNYGFVLDEPDRFNATAPHDFGPKTAEYNDVVITTKGNSAGRVGRIREPQVGSIYSPHLSYWRSRDAARIDQTYLYYWSKGSEFRDQLGGMAASTDMAPYLSLRDQVRLRISLPPIGQQVAIGKILGALDNKIDLIRRMNETLEAMARAIFKDWFVDFGPTRAKMEGRDPYLAPAIWALFPERPDDEGKPKGWSLASLGEHMLKFDSTRVPVSGDERAKRQGPYPYHGATGVMDHVDDYLFDGVYLLVGEDGSVVRENGLGFTQYVWGKFWVNNHAHVLRGKGSVSTEQLPMYFQHESVSPFVMVLFS